MSGRTCTLKTAWTKIRKIWASMNVGEGLLRICSTIHRPRGCSSHSKTCTWCRASLWCYTASVWQIEDMSNVFVCSIITHSVHSCYIRTLCGETHPASGESARCVRPHSFSQLGSPSRSPLMSPPAQQVGTQHSLAPPLPAPVGEVRTFTTGDTFLDVDEILVDDKWVKVKLLPQLLGQQSSAGYRWRWARWRLQLQHWMSSS